MSIDRCAKRASHRNVPIVRLSWKIKICLPVLFQKLPSFFNTKPTRGVDKTDNNNANNSNTSNNIHNMPLHEPLSATSHEVYGMRNTVITLSRRLYLRPRSGERRYYLILRGSEIFGYFPRTNTRGIMEIWPHWYVQCYHWLLAVETIEYIFLLFFLFSKLFIRTLWSKKVPTSQS